MRSRRPLLDQAPTRVRQSVGYAAATCAGVIRSVMGVYAMAERIDYNTAMAPPARWANVEKMRKSDGSIKAALLAVTLPL